MFHLLSSPHYVLSGDPSRYTALLFFYCYSKRMIQMSFICPQSPSSHPSFSLCIIFQFGFSTPNSAVSSCQLITTSYCQIQRSIICPYLTVLTAFNKFNPFFFLFLIFVLLRYELISNVVWISTTKQSDSVVPVYSFFVCLFVFYYGWSQDTEYSFLHYTVGCCCLSILYIVLCIC